MRFPLALLLLLPASLFAQPDTPRLGVASREAPKARLLGLMQGHVTYREANWWARVDHPGMLALAWWPEGAPDSVRVVRAKTTEPEFPMATLTATLLQPGRRYAGEIRWNGRPLEGGEVRFETPRVWQYRTDPPDFRLATGSCAYVNEPGYDRPGKPYGGDYRIFESIAGADADLMLWLGDNTYLRDPDFSSRSGVFHRYAHTRSIPEMARLLREVPQYAIWDDHDYGPNDSDRSWAYRDWALEAFRAFWPNPGFGQPDLGGITTRFTWHDVDVFLLDNRWHRSPDRLRGEERVILGRAQEDWLIESLVSSRAPFKIVAVGGQLLTDAAVYETWTNVAPAERERLLRRIDTEGITGVVFLTGDRHHSEISRVDLPGGAWVYDVTVSPLTSGAHRQNGEPNAHRVAGSLLEQRNFAVLDVSGPRRERVLTVRYFDVDGAPLFEHRIEVPAGE